MVLVLFVVLVFVPPSFLHFTSFSHVIFKQDENAHIFHIHFYIHIHIPIHPIQHPSTMCNIYNSFDALVFYRPLNASVSFITLNALVISTTFGHTGNFYHIRHTHSF